jgi:dihydrofolate synthase/folylpolyglutamate synthase
VDSGLSPYRKALEGLFARTGATSKYGLDRTLAFLATLGNPHEQIRTIHVAGTNGKGSVVAMLYDLLRAKGLSVGRYTSPHLVDFRERIVVDDEQVGEEYVLAFLNRWERDAAQLGATFFEITTSMAFHYFATRQVDVAVIETGLGGRLDSTNVIRPTVSGITSISIDHTEYLGATEEKIAQEKAGIFKAGVPSVIGTMSAAARQAISRTAHNAGATGMIEAQRHYPISNVRVSGDGTRFTMAHGAQSREMHTALIGAAQAGNASVALTMLKAAGHGWAVELDEAAEVLPRVGLRGRFQRVGNRIFDVAHNADGFRLLAETLTAVAPPTPITAVLGILRDKDWRKMISTIAPIVDELVLVAPPSSPADRAWDTAEALSFANSFGAHASVADFGSAVSRDRPGTVLIAGSFHTVGDAFVVLGITAEQHERG